MRTDRYSQASGGYIIRFSDDELNAIKKNPDSLPQAFWDLLHAECLCNNDQANYQVVRFNKEIVSIVEYIDSYIPETKDEQKLFNDLNKWFQKGALK